MSLKLEKKGEIQLSSIFYYIKYYLRFKSWFWFLLFLVSIGGAFSKAFYRHSIWQTVLDVVIGMIFLGIFLRVRFRKPEQEPIEKLKNDRLIILFTFMGAFSGAAILPYLEATLGSQKLEEQLHVPFGWAAALTVLQVSILTLVASVIGFKLGPNLRLDAPIIRKWLYEGIIPRVSKKWAGISITGGVIGTFIISLLEIYLFEPYMPKLPAAPKVSLWANLLTIFYGGIVEEVLLRLFLMTLLVWIFSRFLKSQHVIPKSVYWLSIFISSIFFGLGHLPATANLFGGLNLVLVVRAIVGNGLLGILFGYLYWKKGLEYAMLSHMTGDLFLHAILPLINI